MDANARHILHVDMDAFYAAVEQHDRPELRGQPVLVGGDPHGRGVVTTASYEARPFGCHSAMPMSRAVRLCPQAIIVTPRFERYAEISRSVLTILESFTPLVEPLSVDEAFLDVTGSTGLFGSAVQIGRRDQSAHLRYDRFDRVGRRGGRTSSSRSLPATCASRTAWS